jgi:hypothetical protein
VPRTSANPKRIGTISWEGANGVLSSNPGPSPPAAVLSSIRAQPKDIGREASGHFSIQQSALRISVDAILKPDLVTQRLLDGFDELVRIEGLLDESDRVHRDGMIGGIVSAGD